MDKLMTLAGIFLVLAGLVGLIYGVGINLAGMMARAATDYSFISAYVAEWLFVLIAGLFLVAAGLRKR